MRSRVMKDGLPKRRPEQPETSLPLYKFVVHISICVIMSAQSLFGPSPPSWRACDGEHAIRYPLPPLPRFIRPAVHTKFCYLDE